MDGTHRQFHDSSNDHIFMCKRVTIVPLHDARLNFGHPMLFCLWNIANEVSVEKKKKKTNTENEKKEKNYLLH